MLLLNTNLLHVSCFLGDGDDSEASKTQTPTHIHTTHHIHTQPNTHTHAHIRPHRATPHHITPHHTTPHHNVHTVHTYTYTPGARTHTRQHTTSHHTTPHCTTLHHTTDTHTHHAPFCDVHTQRRGRRKLSLVRRLNAPPRQVGPRTEVVLGKLPWPQLAKCRQFWGTGDYVCFSRYVASGSCGKRLF